MKKHVREVTEQPYGDLKSPFHSPGEGPRRDLKLDEIFTNLIIYEGRVKYNFSGDRMKQLQEYHKANENLRPTRPGDIFGAKKRKILVVGRPGIGKTMFTGLSISFEVASSFWKVGVSLLSERRRREPPRGVWGHAPPENFEI